MSVLSIVLVACTLFIGVPTALTWWLYDRPRSRPFRPSLDLRTLQHPGLWSCSCGHCDYCRTVPVLAAGRALRAFDAQREARIGQIVAVASVAMLAARQDLPPCGHLRSTRCSASWCELDVMDTEDLPLPLGQRTRIRVLALGA